MVGSFLNVCIWRLPAEEQIVAGRSHCRSCRKTIAWYDNIPLVSFVQLKGRCRHCGAKISWLYPFVELITGLLFVGVMIRFGGSDLALVYAVFAAALLVLTMIDLREMILPDEITLPGISFGVIASTLVPALHGTNNRWTALTGSVAGALAGAGITCAISWIGTRLFRRKLQAIGEEAAMGFGDVKLMAMIGAFIGVWKALMVVLLFGPLLGSIVGIFLKLRFGREIVPYGPFLVLGTAVAVLWGDGIIAWYRVALGLS